MKYLKAKTLQKKVLSYIRSNKLLTIIILLSAVLRLVGFYPGYTPFHPDEGYAYGAAVKMIKNFNLDPMRYDYPDLIAIFHAAVYLIINPFFIVYSFIFAPENLPRFKNVINFYQQVIWQNQQTAVLYWARFITGVFGTGSVFLVYLLTHRLFKDRVIALTAAYLTAVNYRQVLNSHFALPDIYNAFFLLLSLLAMTFLLEKPSRRNYLYVGLAMSASFSIKFQIFSVMAFFLVQAFLAWDKGKSKNLALFIKNFLSLNFILALILIPVSAALINFYHLIHWQEFQDINHYTYLQYDFGYLHLNFFPISYFYHIQLGAVLSVSFIFGIFWGLLKYTKSTLILLSVTLPFLFLFAVYSRGFYMRNFVTIVPMMLILAALFLVGVLRFIGTKFKLNSRKLLILILLTTIFLSSDQLRNSSIVAYSYTKPRGYELARDWASKNIPAGSILVTQSGDAYPRNKKYHTIQYESQTVFSLAEMQDENANFGFLNVDWMDNEFYWWMNRDPKDSILFWNKPNTLMLNMYQAVAAQELASYSVAQFVKPWQAPDSNFIIVKIPNKIHFDNGRLVNHFSFDNSLDGWNLIDGDDGPSQKIARDLQEGRDSPGSIEVKQGSRHFPVIRAVSPPIQIKGDRAYQITGWIKSSKELLKKERDGLIRVDFYRDNPNKVTLLTKNLGGSVSSRVFGKPVWQKEDLTLVPPTGANYMTVSFQTAGNNADFWFDDVEILESPDKYQDPREISPYSNYQLPVDALFRYSQANL